LLFVALDRWQLRVQDGKAAPEAPAPEPELCPTSLSDHAVLVGYGRVGSLIGEALKAAAVPFLVIEEREEAVAKLRAEGVEAIAGTAGQRGLLDAVALPRARWLISAIPNPFEGGDLVDRARKANPAIRIVARAHSDPEVDHLRKFGADHIVLGERELAREMVRFILGAGADGDTPEGAAKAGCQGNGDS
jgi:CPA2 family monovalent cation:H+ antiporter-2